MRGDFLHRLSRAAVRYYARWRFRIVNPSTLVFKPQDLKGSAKGYSQAGQDSLIYERFFKGVHNGIFLDVGANDPKAGNNTLLFEEKGWTGIALDPLPGLEEKWAQSGRRARFFNLAVGSSVGRVTFEVVRGSESWNDMLSGVKGKLPRDGLNVQEIEVPTIPLGSLLADQGLTRVDYASIDVEGYEIDALQGVDFRNVAISVLSIENCQGFWREYGNPSIQSCMKVHGYRLYGRILGLDDIYVHRSLGVKGKRV